MITVAEQAIAVPDLKNNRIQLSLRNYARTRWARTCVARHGAPTRRAGAGCRAAGADSACAAGRDEHARADGVSAQQAGLDGYQIELHRASRCRWRA